eukprot:COSAG06_NODE_106_length_23773_cov_20.279083_15_plen_172_part_00
MAARLASSSLALAASACSLVSASPPAGSRAAAATADRRQLQIDDRIHTVRGAAYRSLAHLVTESPFARARPLSPARNVPPDPRVTPYDDDDDDARCDCLGAQDGDDLCVITTVFGQLMDIIDDPNCRAGCAGGTGVCPTDWFPSADDVCTAECGLVFEPFCEREPPPLTPA